MPSDLIQRLRRLTRGFSALCTSEAQAEGLYAEALAFTLRAPHEVALCEPDEATT